MNVGVRRVKLSNGGIPGVFNCRFANPAVVNPNRKKKKPTTFIPPPPPQSQTGTVTTPMNTVGESKQWLGVNSNSRQLIPFWKKSVNSGVIQVILNYYIVLYCMKLIFILYNSYIFSLTYIKYLLF